jgi:ribosomal protein S5
MEYDKLKKENEQLKKQLKEKDDEIKNKEIEKLMAINKIYESQKNKNW